MRHYSGRMHVNVGSQLHKEVKLCTNTNPSFWTVLAADTSVTQVLEGWLFALSLL